MRRRRHRPAVLSAKMGTPTPPGYIDLKDVFRMGANDRKTALNILRGPDGAYMVHFADLATGTMALGFLDRAEISSLRDALARELAS